MGEEDHYVAVSTHERSHFVSKCVGILLLIKSLLWTVMFSLFAYYDEWPSCVAAEGVEQPINLLKQFERNDP